MSRKKLLTICIISDLLTALLAWILFFLFRKVVVEKNPDNLLITEVVHNFDFYAGITVVPIFWLAIYFLNGQYRFVFRKTIVGEFSNTFKTVLFGVIILFFTLLLDDVVKNYRNYYFTGSVLFGLHFILTLIPRIAISKIVASYIHAGKIKFNTILIGKGKEAKDLYVELKNKKPTFGNNFLGYINVANAEDLSEEEYLPYLGCLENLPELVKTKEIQEIIIAVSTKDKNDISEILSWLGFSEITVKALPNLHSVLKGRVKITNILGTPLLEIKHELMPVWQQSLKQIIDIAVATIALLTLSPIFIICAIGIKLTSRGPVFFKQERIGKNGKPFKLIKFRSMHVDAEKDGPNLSSQNDQRRTPFGKILRSTKLDEIPNFINVLIGDMSLVGPRPERQFYIDQIVSIAPHYMQLQKIKPGITSLGQVKYGYARNVDEMTKRLRYDILYIENMSLYTDLLIIYYTLTLLFKGRHV